MVTGRVPRLGARGGGKIEKFDDRYFYLLSTTTETGNKHNTQLHGLLTTPHYKALHRLYSLLLYLSVYTPTTTAMSPTALNPASAIANPSESDIYDRQIRLWGADAQVSKQTSKQALYGTPLDK
jgi:hypothetical protein